MKLYLFLKVVNYTHLHNDLTVSHSFLSLWTLFCHYTELLNGSTDLVKHISNMCLWIYINIIERNISYGNLPVGGARVVISIKIAFTAPFNWSVKNILVIWRKEYARASIMNKYEQSIINFVHSSSFSAIFIIPSSTHFLKY